MTLAVLLSHHVSFCMELFNLFIETACLTTKPKLELNLFPQSPELWDTRHVPPYLVLQCGFSCVLFCVAGHPTHGQGSKTSALQGEVLHCSTS